MRESWEWGLIMEIWTLLLDAAIHTWTLRCGDIPALSMLLQAELPEVCEAYLHVQVSSCW